MVSVGGINFANGVYHNGGINGIEVAILQSAENADNVVNDFEKAFAAGMDPNQTLKRVLDDRRLSEDDFTALDIMKVNRKIEAICHAKNNERRY